jgi:hypothetical protein
MCRYLLNIQILPKDTESLPFQQQKNMIENPFHQKCYVITSSALCNLQVLFYAAFTLFFDTTTCRQSVLVCRTTLVAGLTDAVTDLGITVMEHELRCCIAKI